MNCKDESKDTEEGQKEMMVFEMLVVVTVRTLRDKA